MCNHSVPIWGRKSHNEVTIMVIVANITPMYVDFQADANTLQILCTPSRRGRRCLTNNAAHIREEYRDIQSRRTAGDTSDRERGRCKHHFPTAAHVALALPPPLLYCKHLSPLRSAPPSALSTQGQLVIPCRLLGCRREQFWLHLIFYSDTESTQASCGPGKQHLTLFGSVSNQKQTGDTMHCVYINLQCRVLIWCAAWRCFIIMDCVKGLLLNYLCQGGYVFVNVRLLVGQLVGQQDYTKTAEPMSLKLGWRIGIGSCLLIFQGIVHGCWFKISGLFKWLISMRESKRHIGHRQIYALDWLAF